MITNMHATKVVVQDLDAAERFYGALGLKRFNRFDGGDGNVRQEQSWFSPTGDSRGHVLILSQFLEVTKPATARYPGDFWLAFNVADVDAVCDTVLAQGGAILSAAKDIEGHGLRAAVVADPEGHVIELVGPVAGAEQPLGDPLATHG